MGEWVRRDRHEVTLDYITRRKVRLFRGKWPRRADGPVSALVLVEDASKDTWAIEVRETKLFD